MHFSGNDARIPEVLSELNYSKLTDLFSQIPADILYPEIGMENGVDKKTLKSMFNQISEKNNGIHKYKNFCGAGFYSHYIPAVVDYISSLGSFSTAYTPYQAEVSQGTLQSLFEYQTYIAELSGMDVVNASHYDGATAFAEALRMMYEANKKRGNKLLILGSIATQYSDIIHTYLQYTEAELIYCDPYVDDNMDSYLSDPQLCGVTAVLPDFYGRVMDVKNIGENCASRKQLFHIHADPLLISIIRSPRDMGADVYTAEGQVLGIPVNYGGPYLGIFAVTTALLRKIPGRIAGEAYDSRGKRGFVLALSTREQHIRREKASSNICTNQGLMALRAIVYMAAMGKDGLQSVGKKCISNAHYLIKKLQPLKSVSVDFPEELHFREIAVSCSFSVDSLFAAAQKRGIIPGIKLSEDTLLLATTELHSPEDLNELISIFEELSVI